MANTKAEASVLIEGTRPLFWHAFTPDALSLERKEKNGVAGNDPTEWRRTVLFASDTRQLYIPGSYVFSCVREGGKFLKKGRMTFLSMVTSTLIVPDEFVFIDDRFLPEEPSRNPAEPVYLDVRGVVNPSSRGRNVRYRIACSSGWTCSFHLQWDLSVIGKDQMESILNDAGQFVGIGNGRNISMGRFKVKQYEVIHLN